MESTPEQTSQPQPRFLRALLAALLMSVVATLTWFLPSESAQSIGLAILIATVILTLLNWLIFVVTRNTTHGIKLTARILAALVSLMLLLSVTIYMIAPKQLFYPHNDEASASALAAYPNVEPLTIETEDRVVSGWMIHQAEGKAPLVLYFGGNGEVAAKRILYLVESGDISAFAGCNFAFLDYPGYGLSSGSPSEASLQQMGLDVYDAMISREDVDASRIILFGFSMGTGVANYVAANRTPAGLVLFAPYADGYDLYNTMVPIFYGPLRALVAFRMESVRFAESVSVKPIIFSSVDDEMVPFTSSERLSNAYPAGCAFMQLQGLGHNDYWKSTGVLLNVSQYIAEVIDLGK